MANVFDVARYICKKISPQEGGSITTWKLQKLVYYSQAWSTVWDDRALFEDEIQAWANGPVVPALYDSHRGAFKVEDVPKGDLSALKDDEMATIDAVLKHYGHRSAQYLSALTHAEEPWIRARKGLAEGERGSSAIRLDDLAEYYGGISSNQTGQ